MVELFIVCLFLGALLLANLIMAVAYKIKTHSKKSLWWIMDNVL
jgi:hypothetical protein